MEEKKPQIFFDLDKEDYQIVKDAAKFKRLTLAGFTRSIVIEKSLEIIKNSSEVDVK